MIKRMGLQGPSKKRAFGALALGSTALMSTAALAAGTSAAVLLFTSVGSSDMNGKSMLDILKPVVSALTVTSLTTSSPGKITSDLVTVGSGDRTTSVGNGGQGNAGARPMKLGINVTAINTWTGTRTFMNLAAGSGWQLVINGATAQMTPDRLDADQNVVMLRSGEQANRALTLPTAAYRGQSVDVICRWTGSGTFSLIGSVVKNPRINAKSLTFTWVPEPGNNKVANLRISNIQANDPTRNIDCREADADPNQLFDSTFLNDVRQYNTVRFLKWMTATEENLPVSWSTRTTPRSGVYLGPDGVALEYMVELANQTGTNPWFTIPWNADDEYIRKFAEYVRDHLNPNLTAHVETSNEVWNWVYKVTGQARDEGVARSLGPDDGRSLLRRYAQRSGEVLGIWSDVYKGQMSRLVRIVSTQSVNPWASGEVLQWDNTAGKVDALATGPYFRADLKAEPLTAGGLDTFFQTTLPQIMDQRIELARQQRDVAKRYGLRYITYEAGQHVTAGTDIALLEKIQRDPRMGQMYTRYLNYWRNEFGDLMVLFCDYGSISQFGGWGQQEYIGQPLSEAPKAQAVDLFRRSYLTGNSGGGGTDKGGTSLVAALQRGIGR